MIAIGFVAQGEPAATRQTLKVSYFTTFMTFSFLNDAQKYFDILNIF